MYFIIQEQCIRQRKGEGGSGIRDRPCKASILGFRCKEQPPPSLMTEPLVFIVCNGDGALFYMLLSVYNSVGELTEGWQRVAEHTTNIKSSNTQFYPPDLASKMFSKPASWLWMHKSFLCDRFAGSWSSNGVFVSNLLPFYGYNIVGPTVNTTLRVS